MEAAYLLGAVGLPLSGLAALAGMLLVRPLLVAAVLAAAGLLLIGAAFRARAGDRRQSRWRAVLFWLCLAALAASLFVTGTLATNGSVVPLVLVCFAALAMLLAALRFRAD